MVSPASGRLAVGDEEGILRAIVNGVEAEIGETFFPSLVKHLAEALEVQYAFVSELSADRSCFRTISVRGRGEFQSNIVIPLRGTPCESVLSGQVAHYPDRLQALFPEDEGLVKWGVVSYCGVPLLTASGIVVGHLAIFDDKPMPNGEYSVSIMRIFAARARAEIDRLNAESALRQSEERVSRILETAMDAIVTIDDAHRVVLFNAAAERTFRCTEADAIGQPFHRFLSEPLRATIENRVSGSSGAQKIHTYLRASECLTALRADGEEFPIEATISQLEIRGRNLYTIILRDIQERKQAEAEIRRLNLSNDYLREEILGEHNFKEIVGSSDSLRELLQKVEEVAPLDSTVLINGETGTGKELIARAIHDRSDRKNRPLVKLNCSAISAGLVESELFGHVKGAFTGATDRHIGRFELADHGTLFLDEVSELPLETQVKLLRVLQEKEFEPVGSNKTIRVDVRIIAATNRNLQDAIAAGRFRSDLFYRLNVFPLEVPPLRERRSDIPLLVMFFLKRFSTKFGRKIEAVQTEAMDLLMDYDWPGNIRELQNIIERAVVLTKGTVLCLNPLLLPETSFASPPRSAQQSFSSTATERENRATQESAVSGAFPSLEEMERSHILAALKRAKGVVEGPNGAAKMLNLHPNTLRGRLLKLGIKRKSHHG
jgi:PAS domain S-box-containing protein